MLLIIRWHLSDLLRRVPPDMPLPLNWSRQGALEKSVTPYVFHFPGSYTITYPDNFIEVIPLSLASQRILECSATVRGDHVRPNAFSVLTQRDGGISGQFTSEYSGPHGTGLSLWSGQFLVSDTSTQGWCDWDVADAALSEEGAADELYESIRGGTDISIDGFQLRKTLSLYKDIASVLQKVTSFVIGVKSGRTLLSRSRLKQINKRRRKRGLPPVTQQRDWRDPVQAIGSARLTDIYGLQPTLQSIHDSIVHTRAHYLDVGMKFVGKKTVKRTVNISKSDVLGGYWDVKMKWNTSFRTKYTIYMCIPDNDLTSAARLSSLNPASIAWELMPFSFIVDWFVNIGGFVRGLETAMIYQSYFRYGCESRGSLYTMDAVFTRKLGGTGNLAESRRSSAFGRTVLTSFPFPPPPNLKFKLGSERLLNAAALLTNLLGKK